MAKTQKSRVPPSMIFIPEKDCLDVRQKESTDYFEIMFLLGNLTKNVA